MGEKLRNILEGVNALSHQCIGGECGMLPNYARWGGLEAYPMGVSVTNDFF